MAVVTNLSVPADGVYSTGQSMTFTVTFDTDVDVTGTPQIALTFDSGQVYADYVSGSGANSLTFSYTVLGGAADANGITVDALQAISGSISDSLDSSPADLDLTGHIPSTTGVLVNAATDTTAPAVASVGVPANGTYATGQNLDFTVNFDEAVVVDTTGGTPRIAVTFDTGGTVYASYASGSGSTALVFRNAVPVGAADSNGIVIGALSANGGTLKDAAGNNADLTLNSVGSTAGVLVDGVVDVSIAATSASKAEGSSGGSTAFTFTVTRDSSVGSASVQYAVTGSGGSPANAADFGGTLPSGTLNFTNGQASQVLTVQVTPDQTDESNEGFTVTLSNPTNLTIGTASAAGQIVNDDTPVAPTPEPAGPPVITPPPSVNSLPVAFIASDTADTIAVPDASGPYVVLGMGGDDLIIGGIVVPAQPALLPNVFNGNTGNDTVYGANLSSVLYGGQGADLVVGGIGGDSISGNIGDDRLLGDGRSFSGIYGGGGGDWINGNTGDDVIDGGGGADTLHGGQGNDIVVGGIGDDRVSGDLGNDTLLGEAGADRFVFRQGGGKDVIGDFDAAAGDRIELAAGQSYTLTTLFGGSIVVIDLGGGNTLTILEQSAAFSESWIVFVCRRRAGLNGLARSCSSR